MTEDELNAEVAAKIFGYSDLVTLYRWDDRKKREYPLRRFLKEDQSKQPEWEHRYDYHSKVDVSGKKVTESFKIGNYATDISEAWKVVEAVSKEICDFTLERSGKNWTATWLGFTATDKTPQRAICLAALEFCKGRA